MLHKVKTANLIIKRTHLLSGLLFAAVLALLPISAGAQCTNWDAGGSWRIIQGGFQPSLRLEQKGSVITGTARFHSILSHTTVDVTGTVDGTIEGNSFRIQIYWDNGQTGVYIAKVQPSGRLDGEGYEKNSPNVRATWHSYEVLKCAPPAAPKPIKSSGKMPPKTPPSSKQPTSQPTETAPSPPLEAPFVVASQSIFPTPYVPTGFVILTWDAGPDHPYAEVWFKVNDGEEAFLVEQGKGSRQVMVERGKLYQYILTDDGKTLATVRFVAH